MATIYDIAKIVGVSTATVSRALNNKGYVSEDLKRKIWKVAEELNYVPNAHARSLMSKRSLMISLIIPDIVNPFFSLVARGVGDAAERYGYSLLICNTDGSRFTEKKYVQMYRERQVDGIIFVASESSGSYLQDLVNDNIPIVVADRYVEGIKVDMFLNDNVGGAKEGVAHLIRLGHQRIATIRGPQTTQTGIDRYRGYKEALEDNGLMVLPEYVRDGDYKEISGYREAKKLLQLKEPPTAIFAANDLMALGALYAVEEAGLKVPQDMAVVGYDDIPIASAVRPKLTTVAQPKYELGQLAAERLFELLDEEDGSRSPETVVLQPRLVIRESSVVGSAVA